MKTHEKLGKIVTYVDTSAERVATVDAHIRRHIQIEGNIQLQLQHLAAELMAARQMNILKNTLPSVPVWTKSHLTERQHRAAAIADLTRFEGPHALGSSKVRLVLNERVLSSIVFDGYPLGFRAGFDVRAVGQNGALGDKIAHVRMFTDGLSGLDDYGESFRLDLEWAGDQTFSIEEKAHFAGNVLKTFRTGGYELGFTELSYVVGAHQNGFQLLRAANNPNANLWNGPVEGNWNRAAIREGIDRILQSKGCGDGDRPALSEHHRFLLGHLSNWVTMDMNTMPSLRDIAVMGAQPGQTVGDLGEQLLREMENAPYVLVAEKIEGRAGRAAGI